MIAPYAIWDDRFRLSVAFLTDGYIRVYYLLLEAEEKKNSYTTFRNGIVQRKKICILFSFVEKIIDFLFVSKIGHDSFSIWKMRALKIKLWNENYRKTFYNINSSVVVAYIAPILFDFKINTNLIDWWTWQYS